MKKCDNCVPYDGNKNCWDCCVTWRRVGLGILLFCAGAMINFGYGLVTYLLGVGKWVGFWK